MATTIQFRRGTTAQVDAVTPASGEPIWETDGLKLAIGDGSTGGGLHVIMESDVDDTPVNGATTAPISSNWAYDHATAADPHAGYVLESLFDAYTVLYADTDNTPAALTLAASRIVGRKASGGIAAMTGAETLALLTGANLDVGAFDVRGQTLTADGLTSGRVIFAGANGVLSDDSDFTFATDTLTVTKIAATTFTGAITMTLGAAADSHIIVAGTAKINSGEQAIYVNFPSETAAVNGIWVTLGSTVTSGDLTGIRSRVYGNAASAGANVRGGYLEAKMAAASKYAAMLEGALFHADYSAGSATISGDVRGFTAHISQGSGLNAANLYGGLISVQTRGDETITTDDVGLKIKNEAVGGNGRTMDAAILVDDVNMGGGASGFTYGLDLSGAGIANGDIRFHHGTTLLDDGTDLTLAGANLVGTLNNCVGKGTWTASGTWTMPAVTLGGTVTLNGQSFNAGSGNAQVDTTGSNYGLNVKSTNDDDIGAVLGLFHVSTAPEAGDQIGVLKVYGYDDDSPQNIITAGQWIVKWTSPANGVETTYMEFYLRDSGAPNKAMNISGAGVLTPDHSLMFDQSQDSVAVANQVSLSGYEISAGHRALAVSSEEVVITEALTADRSYPVRINGATYKIMLVAV